MKKILILTASIMLMAAACNKQAAVQPALENQIKVVVEAELNKSETPTGSKLLSVKIDGDKITLDFNKEIQLKGNAAFENTFQGISSAISKVAPEIRGFTVLIEGQRLEEYLKSQETTNWKTYTNVQYGFEIKYPNDYDVLESKDQGAVGVTIYPKVSPKVTKDGVGIQIVIIPDTTVDNYAAKIISNANAAYTDNHLEVYEGRLGGQVAVKTISYVTGKNSPNTIIDTLAQKGSNIYEFRFLETSSDSTESKIYSTFKFTK